MERIIEEMSLEEKLGQLFMSTYETDFLTGEMINLITMYHIGGVLLADPNLNNRKKLTQLNKYLQYYATNNKPLIIASKQSAANNEDDLAVMPREQTLHEIDNR